MRFEYDEFINSIKDLSEEEKHARCQSAAFEAERLRDNVYIGQKRKNNPEKVAQLLDFIKRIKQHIHDHQLFN